MPAACHLPVATDVMIGFRPTDGREKTTANPQVLNREFSMISSLTERCLATWSRDATTLPCVERSLAESDKGIEQ